METLNVGLMGTGNIAPAYIRGCAPFDVINIAACADILTDRAGAFAAEHGLEAYSVDDLLANDDIDIVVNLTLPVAHAEVSLQIINAGKHVYSEKPLALNRADGAAIIKAAAKKGVYMGCAPIPSWAAVDKARAKSLMMARSGCPSRRPPSSSAMDMKAGIPTRAFISSRAAARSSTWVRIT